VKAADLAVIIADWAERVAELAKVERIRQWVGLDRGIRWDGMRMTGGERIRVGKKEGLIRNLSRK
jgi:hypothetical protein